VTENGQYITAFVLLGNPEIEKLPLYQYLVSLVETSSGFCYQKPKVK